MNTIEERAKAYIQDLMLAQQQDVAFPAFLAGAAAMAEMFASGQALKIERAPGKYFIRYRTRLTIRGESTSYYNVRHVIEAYSLDEAMELSRLRLSLRWGTGNMTVPDEIRPANASDTDGETLCE